jgi:hypothetical protein
MAPIFTGVSGKVPVEYLVSGSQEIRRITAQNAIKQVFFMITGLQVQFGLTPGMQQISYQRTGQAKNKETEA